MNINEIIAKLQALPEQVRNDTLYIILRTIDESGAIKTYPFNAIAVDVDHDEDDRFCADPAFLFCEVGKITVQDIEP